MEAAPTRAAACGAVPLGESGGLKVAKDIAFAPRGTLQLASVVTHDVPEIGLKIGSPTVAHAGELPIGLPVHGGGCGACRVGDNGSEVPTLGAVFASLAAALAWFVRRRDKDQQD